MRFLGEAARVSRCFVAGGTRRDLKSFMLKDKFALGIDFGTESGRVVLVRVRDGEEVASAVIPYPDGVIDEKLLRGPRLEPDCTLFR